MDHFLMIAAILAVKHSPATQQPFRKQRTLFIRNPLKSTLSFQKTLT